MKNTSWKTSVSGALGVLSVLLVQLSYVYDNIPTTNPDWSVVMLAFTGFLTGLVAKDYNVTGVK